MEIKICGLTRPEEANYINDTSVDYAGFVFYEKSKRNVSQEQAREIMAGLDERVKKVAVMVSPDADFINRLQTLPIDILQIHKELSVEALKAAKLPVWYAINVADEDEALKKQAFIDELPKELSSKIEAILVDAPDFGSGKTFNWRKSRRLLKAGAQSPPDRVDDQAEEGQSLIAAKRKFILAGGLNPENVAEGIEIFNPDIVDVSSGVEGANGKDETKVKAFVDAVRATGL